MSELESKPLSDLCIEMVEACILSLQAANALDDEEVVHGLRVATKRLRSAWHLVKKLCPKHLARERRDALRDLSAHLSSRRDVTVLENLVRELEQQQSGVEDAYLIARIGDSLRQKANDGPRPASPDDALLEEIRNCLEAEIEAWRSIDRSHYRRNRSAIRRELRKTYSRARKKTREAQDTFDSETWHDWRKRVKRLRYQREFIAEAGGRLPGKFDARISRLGTALGQRNDLANLWQHIESEASAGKIDKKELKTLGKIVRGAERDILGNCRRLGRRAFLKKKG